MPDTRPVHVKVGDQSIGADPALFNAMARGINVRLLASVVSNGPSDRPAAFIMRTDLLDSRRYTSPNDLKGMKFAVPGPARQVLHQSAAGPGREPF